MNEVWLKRRWKAMLDRCYYRLNISYNNYGGRGITVCEDWKDFDNYQNWFWSQPGASRLVQVDRIDNNKEYSPLNCRLATVSDNARNRSDNVFLDAFDEVKVIAAWLEDERCLTTKSTLYQRIAAGWDHERAITEPNESKKQRFLSAFNETKTWSEWLLDKRCKVNKEILIRRIDLGWNHEEAISAPPNSTRKGKIPGNVKWIKAWGEEKITNDWLNDSRLGTGVKDKLIHERLAKGFTPEDAISRPTGNQGTRSEVSLKDRIYTAFGKSMSAEQWLTQPECLATDLKMMYVRINRGWDFEKCLTQKPREIKKK